MIETLHAPAKDIKVLRMRRTTMRKLIRAESQGSFHVKKYHLNFRIETKIKLLICGETHIIKFQENPFIGSRVVRCVCMEVLI
jgi:hypothetical protein